MCTIDHKMEIAKQLLKVQESDEYLSGTKSLVTIRRSTVNRHLIMTIPKIRTSLQAQVEKTYMVQKSEYSDSFWQADPLVAVMRRQPESHFALARGQPSIDAAVNVDFKMHYVAIPH